MCLLPLFNSTLLLPPHVLLNILQKSLSSQVIQLNRGIYHYCTYIFHIFDMWCQKTKTKQQLPCSVGKCAAAKFLQKLPSSPHQHHQHHFLPLRSWSWQMEDKSGRQHPKRRSHHTLWEVIALTHKHTTHTHARRSRCHHLTYATWHPSEMCRCAPRETAGDTCSALHDV